MAAGPRDQNRIVVIQCTSSLNSTRTVTVAVNPTTNAIVVEVV